MNSFRYYQRVKPRIRLVPPKPPPPPEQIAAMATIARAMLDDLLAKNWEAYRKAALIVDSMPKCWAYTFRRLTP